MAQRRLDPTCPVCGGDDRTCPDRWHLPRPEPDRDTLNDRIDWTVAGLVLALLFAVSTAIVLAAGGPL